MSDGNREDACEASEWREEGRGGAFMSSSPQSENELEPRRRNSRILTWHSPWIQILPPRHRWVPAIPTLALKRTGVRGIVRKSLVWVRLNLLVQGSLEKTCGFFFFLFLEIHRSRGATMENVFSGSPILGGELTLLIRRKSNIYKGCVRTQNSYRANNQAFFLFSQRVLDQSRRSTAFQFIVSPPFIDSVLVPKVMNRCLFMSECLMCLFMERIRQLCQIKAISRKCGRESPSSFPDFGSSLCWDPH